MKRELAQLTCSVAAVAMMLATAGVLSIFVLSFIEGSTHLHAFELADLGPPGLAPNVVSVLHAATTHGMLGLAVSAGYLVERLIRFPWYDNERTVPRHEEPLPSMPIHTPPPCGGTAGSRSTLSGMASLRAVLRAILIAMIATLFVGQASYALLRLAGDPYSDEIGHISTDIAGMLLPGVPQQSWMAFYFSLLLLIPLLTSSATATAMRCVGIGLIVQCISSGMLSGLSVVLLELGLRGGFDPAPFRNPAVSAFSGTLVPLVFRIGDSIMNYRR